LIENYVRTGSMFHEYNLAPGAPAVLDSMPMHSSAGIFFSPSARKLRSGLLALLLLRR
jgi:hypothetical protein